MDTESLRDISSLSSSIPSITSQYHPFALGKTRLWKSVRLRSSHLSLIWFLCPPFQLLLGNVYTSQSGRSIKTMFVSNWLTGSGAVSPYCLQVKKKKPLSYSLGIPKESEKKTNPPCLTFAETLVATGSSYNSYQLPLKFKQSLSNSNQTDRLSSGLAEAGEYPGREVDPDYINTLIMTNNNK